MRTIDVDALKKDLNMAENCDECPTNWKECEYDTVYSKKDFCQWLDDAPTIEPTPHWIPCSERPPKGLMVKVLVSAIDSDGLPIIPHVATYDGFTKTWSSSLEIANVEAWMPLPKPYKGEYDERD